MFREGQQIGLYILVRKLGRGGFGEVWLAERKAKFITKRVAVKLPLDEQVDHDAVKQEATLWEHASGHPNILPIIDADEYDGQIVIVSEYAPDGSLADKLKSEGKFPFKQAVEVTIGILDGLQFLHSKRIIHRDIKPQNILLQGNTPRLADFGISRAMQTTAINSTIIGTDAYMSPEAFDGKRNVQTDIWSVGVVLYELLSGNLPFSQQSPSERMFAILTKDFAPLPDDFPQSLRNILNKALAKQPENRYQTASQMRDDLQAALLNLSPQSTSGIKQSLLASDFDDETETELITRLAKAAQPQLENFSHNNYASEASNFSQSQRQEKQEAIAYNGTESLASKHERLNQDGRKSPLYYRFWERLLAYGKTQSSIHEYVKPRYNDGICIKNVRGLKFHYVVNQFDGRVEFYIDRGNKDLNKRTFDELVNYKDEINTAFGKSLSWERLESRKSCRLGYYFEGGVKSDEPEWQRIHSEMVDAMIRLVNAVSPFIPMVTSKEKPNSAPAGNIKLEFIESIVSRSSSLSFQINQNEYRIMKSRYKGSLWIGKRYDGFRLQTTSDIATLLDGEITRLYGSEIGEQKGYKYWYIDDPFIVEEILDIYDRG